MKTLSLLMIAVLVTVITFMQLTTKKTSGLKNTEETTDEFVLPENIKAIVDKSCFGCHSADGKSDEAKEALRWDQMGEYDKEKLIAVYDEIIEVIEEMEMPPKKFLERFPDARPSDEEYAALLDWAEVEAEKLFE